MQSIVFGRIVSPCAETKRYSCNSVLRDCVKSSEFDEIKRFRGFHLSYSLDSFLSIYTMVTFATTDPTNSKA